MTTNPYAALPDHRFWRRSVSRIEPHRIDPVVAPKFTIDRTTRVATAGSCFAQHISRRLRRMGFGYFVPEDGRELSEGERARRNFGVFSARYGNLYTVRQLLQLYLEAFEGRTPVETAWKRPDGRFVDPYRPQVEPDGFADEAEVATARRAHLAEVRRVFAETGVLVFTLGLTEAWRSKVDGSVFPLAPGVVAGAFDPAIHEFHNFEVGEVIDDLEAFLTAVKALNPALKVLLTVSPVPLIATFEDRHVVVSTTYSKSVLRVAADVVARRHDWVDYFPSYEIITGSFSGGVYWEADHREVNSIGVAHAMRCFAAHYLSGPGAAPIADDAPPRPAAIPAAAAEGDEVVCDEEAIDAIRPSDA